MVISELCCWAPAGCFRVRFYSHCVSILASGMLCCHRNGFLPLCFSLCGSGRRVDPCLGWGNGSENLLRCHSSLPCVTPASALVAPFVKHFGFSVWGVLYKKASCCYYLSCLFTGHISQSWGMGKKQAISRFTLFTFHFTFGVWGMLIC